MSLTRLIAKTVAAPVKAVVSLPKVAAAVVDEVGKAAAGKDR
jgi:hypothetical protein